MNTGTGILSPPKTPDIGDDVEDPIATRAKELAEGKNASKCVRFLTVMAYVLSVSMAAILLSLYYIFIWQPEPKVVEEPEPPDALQDINYLAEARGQLGTIFRNGSTVEEIVTMPYPLHIANKTIEENSTLIMRLISHFNDTKQIFKPSNNSEETMLAIKKPMNLSNDKPYNNT